MIYTFMLLLPDTEHIDMMTSMAQDIFTGWLLWLRTSLHDGYYGSGHLYMMATMVQDIFT